MATITAVVIIAAAYVLSPNLVSLAFSANYAWAHELGHVIATLAAGGSVDNVSMSVEASSPSEYRAVTDLHSVTIAAVGMLGPAVLSSLLIFVGLTRCGLHVCLFIFSIVMTATAWTWVMPDDINLLLICLAFFVFLVTMLPLNAFVAATVALAVGFILGIGVLGSLNTLYAAQYGGLVDQPTDSQIIADILGTKGLSQVGNTLAILMFLPYAVCLALTAFWHDRHHI